MPGPEGKPTCHECDRDAVRPCERCLQNLCVVHYPSHECGENLADKRIKERIAEGIAGL